MLQLINRTLTLIKHRRVKSPLSSFRRRCWGRCSIFSFDTFIGLKKKSKVKNKNIKNKHKKSLSFRPVIMADQNSSFHDPYYRSYSHFHHPTSLSSFNDYIHPASHSFFCLINWDVFATKIQTIFLKSVQ